jgi:aspartyl-tRNA(Asn)/glutamyl-tRNA(Gln) amidotransferase subunit B
MRERGLEQVSDVGALESAVKKVLDENPNELERYRQGETKLLGFFVGQVMKASSGKADPKKVGKIVLNRLKQ